MKYWHKQVKENEITYQLNEQYVDHEFYGVFVYVDPQSGVITGMMGMELVKENLPIGAVVELAEDLKQYAASTP